MADIPLTEVHIVEWTDKFDAPVNEVLGYEALRFHTDGTVTPANGTTETEAAFQGINTTPGTRIGKTVTVVRDGLLDVGDALDGLAPGAPIYLSDEDGQLASADTDATVPVIVGRVEPAWGRGISGADLLLRVRREVVVPADEGGGD